MICPWIINVNYVLLTHFYIYIYIFIYSIRAKDVSRTQDVVPKSGCRGTVEEPQISKTSTTQILKFLLNYSYTMKNIFYFIYRDTRKNSQHKFKSLFSKQKYYIAVHLSQSYVFFCINMHAFFNLFTYIRFFSAS